MKGCKTVSTFLILICCMSICGCGKQGNFPELSPLGNVYSISREEGSGTREEFEHMVNTKEEGRSHLCMSTTEVVETVAGNNSSIGYIAFSSLSDDSVKCLQINKVSATEETIENGKYALCRNYYLAYNGELTDLQRDFLAFITSSGQSVVDEYCVPVKKSGTFLSDKSQGTITLNGSSSMENMMKGLIEKYKEYNPNAQIIMNVTDSSTGLNAAIGGECDFAMSSRELKDYEEELLTTKTIAKDGIVIVVHKENPLESITVKQLKKIYDTVDISWDKL